MKILIFLAIALCITFSDALNKETDCKCRISVQKRLAGGKDVDNQLDYSWIARLRQNSTPDQLTDPVCDVLILNENHVLTTSECLGVDYLKMDYLRERILKEFNIEFRGTKQRVDIEDIFIHPDLKHTDSHNFTDSPAILKLKEKLNISGVIQPACFDTKIKFFYDGPLRIAGMGIPNEMKTDLDWSRPFPGRSSGNPYRSKTIREGDVFDVTKTDSKCANEKEKYICVNNLNESVVACSGDIALHQTKNGKSKIIGLFHYLPPFEEIEDQIAYKCRNFSSSKFMRISYYHSFIKAIIGDNFCY